MIRAQKGREDVVDNIELLPGQGIPESIRRPHQVY